MREIDALGKLVPKAVNFRAPQIGQHERTEQQHRRERRARERRNPAQHEAWLQDGDGDHEDREQQRAVQHVVARA